MNLTEIFNDQFWYMAPTLVALTTLLAGTINQAAKFESSFLKQVIAWVSGALLSCGSILLGFLGDDIGWQSYVALSVVVGLSSNGVYDISVIHNWISTWFTKSPTTK